MAALDETLIRDLIESWAQAVATGDRAGTLAHHSENIVMIDFPNTVRGIKAYATTWDFFDDSRRGTVVFAPSEIEVTAGKDVAFVHCSIHCDGTTGGSFDLRLTTCLVKRGEEWVVTHEHHSVPTKDDVLIGPDVPKGE